MIHNPYPDPIPGSQHHKVTGRVSQDDYHFLKEILPQHASSDWVVSNLYKKFIDELRKLRASGAFNDPKTGLFDPGWYIESPTYLLVERVLSEFQRCPVGVVAGAEAGGTEPGGTGGVCETVRSPAQQRTEPEGSVKKRRKRSEETKGKEEK